MKRVSSRRSLLRALGATATATLAGCNALRNNNTPDSTDNQDDNTPSGQDESTTPPEDSDQEAEATEDADELALAEEAAGRIKYATAVDTVLTYATGGGRQRVVYGGNEERSFAEVSEVFYRVDGGVAYVGFDREDETAYNYIMSGGDELTRFPSPDPTGVYNRAAGNLFDALNGEPLWATWDPEDEKPTSFMHGTTEIEPNYEAIDNVSAVGDEIGFVAYESTDSASEWQPSAIVVGDAVVEELDPLWRFQPLRGIAGEPTYVKDEGDGSYIQHGDEQVGGSYTVRGDGEFMWIGELDGNLAFIAEVAEDKISDPDRSEEQALWYDGTEIARYEEIGNTTDEQVAIVDDGVAYQFSDTDSRGLAVGDNVIEDEISPSQVASIDGDVAYNVFTEDGSAVVYQGQQTEPYNDIKNIFELDGDLAFLAQHEEEQRSGKIMREI